MVLLFQLPLSGSLTAFHGYARRVDSASKAFNSLFRDHKTTANFSVDFELRTFNSLFRDHQVMVKIRKATVEAFNSLFRDHSQLQREDYHVEGDEVFQLPLSGSPESIDNRPVKNRPSPFNSLFRDHRSLMILARIRFPCSNTFNSLFRDHLG